jgi:predicted alpha/beta superfamily hydrolase
MWTLLLLACGPGRLDGEVTELSLDSPETGTTYEVRVFVPASWDGATPLNVVVAHDGDQWFEWTAWTAQELSLEGAIDPPLVAAVGYGEGENLRLRDDTPPSEHEDGGGGVEDFHAFLADTLLPALDAGWPTAATPASRVLVGHSLGGLSTGWALLTGAPFGGFVALSPSFYWGHTMIFDQEADQRASGVPLEARVYLAAGASERWGLPALTLAMGEQLDGRGDPGLSVSYELLDGSSHPETYPPGVEAGLRYTLEGL